MKNININNLTFRTIKALALMAEGCLILFPIDLTNSVLMKIIFA